MTMRLNKILKLCGFEPSRLRQEATALWHGAEEGVRTLKDRLICAVVGDYNDYIIARNVSKVCFINGINLRPSKVGLGPRQLNCSLFVSDCLNFSHFQTSDPLEFACF